jgi:ABC-2 type transport system permease protein
VTDLAPPPPAPAPSASPRHTARAGRDAARAVAHLAVRQTWRGALVVVLLAGAMTAVVAAGYRTTVGDDLDAQALAALAGSPAIRTLFGEPVALDTAGGFTVWRTGTVLAVLLAAWSFLGVVRVTRGEEDAGRWDLLLAGRMGLPAIVSSHLTVFVAADLLAGAAAAGALVAAGTAVSGAVMYGLGLALVGVVFAGTGAVTAQLLSSRGAAVGASAAVLGLALLVRTIGDGVEGLAWARWTTPFGLTALTRPYAGEDLLPLVVLVVLAVVPLAVAPALAARRDLRGAWFPAPTHRRPRPWLLGSPWSFAVRRATRPFLGWATGIAAWFLLIGLLAAAMPAFLRDNPRFAALADAAGFSGLVRVEGYVAALFTLLAIPLGVFVAVRMAALAHDEVAGRLWLLLAGTVRRRTLLLAEMVAALLGAVALAVTAGTVTGLGAALVGAPLALPVALAGTLNVLPVAVLCLGAAVAALGWAPRAVAALGALPAVGGFLLHVTAESAGAPGWVVAISPFAHLTPVPDQPPDMAGLVGLTLAGVVLGLVGLVGYTRRDLC